MLDFDIASSLEGEIWEEEIKAAVFNLGEDKAPGPDGFPLVFFWRFWEDITEDLKAFLKVFRARDKLSRHIGASFITLLLRSQELCLSRFFVQSV